MKHEHTNDSPELTGEARMHDLLCRYVFGEATDAERIEVDAALSDSESLRAQKVELEATVALIQGAMTGSLTGSGAADGSGAIADAGASLSPSQLEELESAAREAATKSVELKPVLRGPRPWYASPAVQFAAAATVLLSIGAFYVPKETPASGDTSVASGDEMVREDQAVYERRSGAGSINQKVAMLELASLEDPDEEAEEFVGQVQLERPAVAFSKTLAAAEGTEASTRIRQRKIQHDAKEALESLGYSGGSGGGGGYRGPGDSAPPGGGGPQAGAPGLASSSSSSSDDFFLGRGKASPGAVKSVQPPEAFYVEQSVTDPAKSVVAMGGFDPGSASPVGATVTALTGSPSGPSSPGPAAPAGRAAHAPATDPAAGVPSSSDIGAFFDDGADGSFKARVEDLYDTPLDGGLISAPSSRGAGLPLTRFPKERPRDMFFRFWGDNPFVATRGDALSTFAADVDTASFTLARRMLRSGILPRRDQIRTEEFVNFPAPDLAAPTDDTFAVYGELAPSPFGGREDRWLLRVGVRAKDVAREERPPLALTFVVDTSGSMRTDNRLELVKHSLRLLVNQLDARDTLAIVGFSNEAREILPPTPASASDTIETALFGLQPDGGTNAEAGLKLGYALSLDGPAPPNAQKRVVFLSDGVANMGQTDQDRLASEISAFAEQGVFLNTIGVGMSNHNDVFLEQLANKGQGVCDYVADAADARRAIVDRFVSGFVTVAKDLKIQVEFDGAAVLRWRQLGYENRAVADNDFRNDKVDAGEVGAGHQVTCYYEIELASGASDAAAALAKVRLRWKPVDPMVLGARTTETRETESTFRYEQIVAASFRAASPGYRLGALSAQLAECLRQSFHARGDSMDYLAKEFANLLTDAPSKDVAAMAEAVKLGRDLGLQAPPGPQPTDEDAAQQEAYYRFLIESLGGADAPEGPAATPLGAPKSEAYELRIRELLNRDQGEDPH